MKAKSRNAFELFGKEGFYVKVHKTERRHNPLSATANFLNKIYMYPVSSHYNNLDLTYHFSLIIMRFCFVALPLFVLIIGLYLN